MEFNYQDTLLELEKLLEKVEDPSTGLQDIDKSIREAGELVKSCREYLRSAREKLERPE